MMTFEFRDAVSGGCFFVESETLREAKDIAHKYFRKPNYIDEFHNDNEMDMMYVESMGFDTY